MNFKGYLLIIIIPSFSPIVFAGDGGVIFGVSIYLVMALWGYIGYRDEFEENSKKNITQIESK